MVVVWAKSGIAGHLRVCGGTIEIFNDTEEGFFDVARICCVREVASSTYGASMY